MYDVKTQDDLPFLPTTADRATSSSNATAVVTYSAGVYRRQSFHGLAWSYNGVPTTGRLFVTIDGNVVFDIDITNGGPGFIWFPRRMGGRNIVITLAAGGTSIVGKLNVLDHQIR